MALRDYITKLSYVQREHLEMESQALIQGYVTQRIQEIDEELKLVIQEIEDINTNREALSSHKVRLENLVTALGSSADDLETRLLHAVLSNRLDFVVGQIAELKPIQALKRKYNLTKERKMLELGQQLGSILLQELSNLDLRGME